MICPHCNYEHGWNGKNAQRVEGDKGEFFMLTDSYGLRLHLVRETTHEKAAVNLFACPNCRKTFVDD